MKNIKIKYMFSLLLVLFLLACEKNYEDLYTLTNYANFKMEGNEIVIHPLGTAYVDPPVTATEAGVDLPVTTTILGDIFSGNTSFDPNVADRYIYTYSAVNSDGYPGTTTRWVYNVNTGDLINSIEGVYTSTVDRVPEAAGDYTDMEHVMIIKTGDNTYELSDAIGGYYDIGRDYGAAFRASGLTITAISIPNNQFTFSTVEVGTFGGEVTIKSMVVDPVAKTIVITNEWSPYTFTITLKQVQP